MAWMVRIEPAGPVALHFFSEDFERVDHAAVQAVRDRVTQAVDDCLRELETLTGRRYASSCFEIGPDGEDAYGCYTLADADVPRT